MSGSADLEYYVSEEDEEPLSEPDYSPRALGVESPDYRQVFRFVASDSEDLDMSLDGSTFFQSLIIGHLTWKLSYIIWWDQDLS